MKTKANIEQHLAMIPIGKPFTALQVTRLGNRAAADQALSRMAKAGQLFRVARGIYVKPRQSAIVGVVRPGAYEVAQAICEAEGSSLAVHGAAWAYHFGLTTQLMANPTYLTDGSTRHVHLGKATLTLLHASPRTMRLASSPGGRAILALEWLQGTEDPVRTFDKVRSVIGNGEFAAFLAEAEAAGGWLAAAARAFKQVPGGA